MKVFVTIILSLSALSPVNDPPAQQIRTGFDGYTTRFGM